MSNANNSELIATFTDYDDDNAPGTRAVRLKLIADVCVIYVGRLVEGDGEEVGVDTFTFDDKLSVGVDAELLYQTLGAMLRRDDRHAFDRLVEGSLRADHPTVRSQQLVVSVPAVRTRA